ncbi:4Fe-4S dicluster domain-containing protein [Desulfobacula toluolica]|uniref:Na(+)-translocating NADH-quinone reductase subunit A n=1 Tax=Desulfobacula toluolica (strain DSM 7467 / Tol2) TaxID=651182 RepID=K0NQ79_DESTT|nr:4Fe-4S dicluster domain-containing protein [Desulfobacula toluolica]CCK81032.1 NqrA: Na(+)-translocating NADH-quinone reductase, subunit A [Desulfobacula toluolica Tol2]
MKHIKLSKGFKTQLAGIPDLSIIHMPEPETIALSAMDIPYIRPKLLVKENDPVKTGTPLFCDKRNTSVVYVSPGTGTVKQIVFGERRRLKEVVICLEKKDEFIRFDPLSSDSIQKIGIPQIIEQLQQGGLWQCFREFPSKDTACQTHEPPMIIVSLNGNDPFSPEPWAVLENETVTFELGIKLLKRFSKQIIVTSRQSSLERLNGFKKHITHTVPDFYPAWDPGVVLYHLKTSQEDNLSWCISAEHLILVVKFLLTGTYPVKRVVTVTRPKDKKPHIIIRQGTSVKNIVGRIEDNNIITTGRFNGRSVDPQSHIGFFDTTLNLIPDPKKEQFLGFIQPGLTKPTVSKTFLSCLTRTPKDLDCTLHGEQRACINCGYCTKICPVDLMPNFIMKALMSDDIEDALSYGLLDCCRCGLCSYACPSKIELTKILSDGMDSHYKDKQ